MASTVLSRLPGLSNTIESEGLLWIDPLGSAGLSLYLLQLDASQYYPNAQTGWALPPEGRYGGDPYWIGKWVEAGYAVMVDLETATYGPPYRIYLAADPFYVKGLADASRSPRLYGIVDAPPELAAEASRQLGYPYASGYGFEQQTTPTTPSWPTLPQMPSLPPLPGFPSPVPTPAPTTPPAAAPAPAAAETPAWLLPAAGVGAGAALLWYLRRTGRI